MLWDLSNGLGPIVEAAELDGRPTVDDGRFLEELAFVSEAV